MDPLNDYRSRLQELMRRYHSYRPPTQDIETELIADTEHDHYQLVHVGWQNGHRVYGCVLHVDIKDGKIWIQYNSTEHDVAEDLVALGVPVDHIVIGFHAPYARQFTEFAVS